MPGAGGSQSSLSSMTSPVDKMSLYKAATVAFAMYLAVQRPLPGMLGLFRPVSNRRSRRSGILLLRGKCTLTLLCHFGSPTQLSSVCLPGIMILHFASDSSVALSGIYPRPCSEAPGDWAPPPGRPIPLFCSSPTSASPQAVSMFRRTVHRQRQRTLAHFLNVPLRNASLCYAVLGGGMLDFARPR